MNFEYLNQMIKYIEEHLTENIEYKELAKIVGISEYNLQRIFAFLTNMSISEYIRKRRLSRAFEELKTTNIKIIDLAIKYNYDSSMSFSRVFKQYFNMTPTECRSNLKNYKLFPIIEFHNDNNMYDKLNYEIKEVQKKKLYCYGVSALTHEDLLFKIRELYDKIEKNGIRDKFNKAGMYGISICEDDKYKYYIGSELKLDDTETIIIDKGKYAVFEVGNEEQKDIVKVYDFVYSRWLKSTTYEIIDKPEIELYENNNCYIYIPIKDKQN